MVQEFIVKFETVKGSKRKVETVTIHSQDRSVDIEKPLDEPTRMMLGTRFKAYFKARLQGEKLVLLGETTWNEWNKGR
ncbi:MAG: hypothetical protein H7249_00340 [Chitinophagaceae bacterium]|nr:hypothetical protein [Oligoflexus sp.]